MYKNNKVVYSISVEDIQSVSQEKLGRKLTDKEIDKIIRDIDLEWYDEVEALILSNIEGEI